MYLLGWVRFVVLVGALACASLLQARSVSVEESLRAAQTWISRCPLFPAGTSVESMVEREANRIYFLSPRGTVVLSQDTDYQPVRWFSTQTIAPEDWAEPVRDQLASAPAVNEAAAAQWERLLLSSPMTRLLRTAAPTGSSDVVGPLLKTCWNQGSLYNAMCPLRTDGATTNGGRMVTGCVATAMAQLLNYYQWPRYGKAGSVSTSDYDLDPYSEFRLPYDYEATLSHYLSVASQREILATALLAADCAASVDMGYGNTDSAAMSESFKAAFQDCFYYDLQAGNKDQLSENAIQTALRDGRPLYVSGGFKGTESGHAYVCDGMCEVDGQTYYHFNYGWGSEASNGWSVRAESDQFTHNVFGALTPSNVPVFRPHEIVSTAQPAPLMWDVAPYHAKNLASFTLNPEQQIIAISETTVDPNLWDAGKGSNAGEWGITNDPTTGNVMLKTVTNWGSKKYPLMFAYFHDSIPVKANTVLSFKYRIRANDLTTLKLVSFTEGSPVGPFAEDWGMTPDTTLISIPKCTSSAWQEVTATYTIAKDIDELKLAITFDNSTSVTVATDYDFFEIVSVTLNGAIATWDKQPVITLPGDARSYQPSLKEGTQRFTLVANYKDNTTAQAPTTPILTVNATADVPTIGEPTISGSTLTYPVTAKGTWTARLTSQFPETLKPTKTAKTATSVAYTFAKPLATGYGTHWIGLDVSTESATRSHTFILNPPAEDPIRGVTAYSYSEAIALAKKLNRPIFAMSFCDDGRPMLQTRINHLHDDAVVQSINNDYIYWEMHADQPEEEALLLKWCKNPMSSGIFTITGQNYGMLLDPYAPDVALKKTNNYSFYALSDFTTFLSPVPSITSTGVFKQGFIFRLR